jgi:hypothetical protein
MRKRHRIKAIRTSDYHHGFGIFTNGGGVWFNFGNLPFCKSKLKSALPHIYDELITKKPQTKKELETILLGRYVYGRSRDYTRDGISSKILS